jgi:two-component system chemotaxis response regulator CheB
MTRDPACERSSGEGRPIRVLVVDDSAYVRQTITTMLESDARIRVVGRAADGAQALVQLVSCRPDVITLDLEMPRMGGLAFLRILMQRQPTPVIVVSAHASGENVFRALDLGAVDFIAKPTVHASPELRQIQGNLVRTIHACAHLGASTITARARMVLRGDSRDVRTRVVSHRSAVGARLRVCAIGASTGGPPALRRLAALDPRLPLSVLITQHMPASFIPPFAARLGRGSRFAVAEARGGERLRPGLALVAPGSGSLTIVCDAGEYRVRIEATRGDPLVPSVDRMLMSAAEAAGPELCAVVLTGMGNDGSRGAQVAKRRGATVLAESSETAVIFGMPQQTIATGAVDEVLPLDAMADAITRFATAARTT